jgi:hypothetical protein
MDRVAAFLGERLRGRQVPADLRRLVELQLDGVLGGRDCPQPFAETRVLGPGERHDLEDHLAGLASADPDEETRANARAMAAVLGHVAVVVDGFNGDLFGYWLHPDDSAADRPYIVKLDTEGEFDTPGGSTLVDAMVFDWAGEDDIAEIARIAAFCDRHGIPLEARAAADLVWPKPAVHPAVLHARLYKTNVPLTARPDWADGLAADARAGRSDPPPLGARLTDPRLLDLAARVGLPADLLPLIRAADSGEGEVRLTSERAEATLEFYQEDEGSWWLHKVMYRRPGAERPVPAPLPFGCSFDERRADMRARLGTHSTAMLIPVDRWEIGELSLWVMFDKADEKPRRVECWPTAMPMRG